MSRAPIMPATVLHPSRLRPSDAEVDKIEKARRRLIEMGRTVLKDVEKKN
jgi:hypothetical protein